MLAYGRVTFGHTCGFYSSACFDPHRVTSAGREERGRSRGTERQSATGESDTDTIEWARLRARGENMQKIGVKFAIDGTACLRF